MRCPSCEFDNPSGVRFCGACGVQLASGCPQCGAPVPVEFRFCGACGAALERRARAPVVAESPGEYSVHRPPLSEAAGAADAERRQITVMFCDLVGSTPLSERLDPEDLREIVRAYQQASAEVIDRFDGHLAQYHGDGLLVYFGYPRAHEDDAQRAVRAAIGIIARLAQLNVDLESRHATRLSARLGIHTGLVVAGEMGGGNRVDPMAIVGETPNLAARLQALADPNTVVISATTHRLVRGFFEFRDLGAQSLKGLSTPMQVYQVLRESTARSRLDVADAVGLTPLVGREQEVGLLMDRWEQVKDGLGQVVFISGEAGLGKSRLVQVMRERLATEPHTWVECRCSAYHQDSAFHPVIEQVERLLAFHRDDSAGERARKLESVLTPYANAIPEVVPLFAALLSVPLPERYAPLNLSPQAQKQKILDAVLALLLQLADRNALVLVMEDLHWIDPSTLELLSRLLDQGPMSRMLAVLTFRPEFHPPWPNRSYLTHVMLNRLPRKQTEVMVRRVVGGKTLPAEVEQQLVTKTDGVPLFVEELVKMVLESGLLQEQDDTYALAGPLPPLAIPTTLQDSLMARLDRLATVKEVVQLGATLGREFTYEVLRAVSSLDDSTLQHELSRLVGAELLYQRGTPPDAAYTFKHALIRDAAYQSLLRSKRQQYHQQIAQTLAEKFPIVAETQPELLAYHYATAGLDQQAIIYWQVAGQRAFQRSANVEAIRYIRKGLELLAALPAGPERAAQELMLQISLGLPLMATKGYAAPEAEQAFHRARTLCAELGDSAQVFPVLRGLWEFYVVRGMITTAQPLAEQLWTLAQSVDASAFRLEATFAMGETSFFEGKLLPALGYLEHGIRLYNQDEHHAHAFLYGEDPGVMCRNYAAWSLWHLGYPDQALQRSNDAVAMAQAQGHPFTLAIALCFATAVHQLRDDRRAMLERAEAAIALSSEQGFPLWRAMGRIFRGWAWLRLGQKAEGNQEIREGLSDWRATGAELGLPFVLGMLADAAGEIGEIDEGLAALDEALATVTRGGERHYEAELHRLKAELTRKRARNGAERPSAVDAERDLRRAIDIARGDGARSLELRAATSLARVLADQGRPKEARRMLAEVHGWFSEGFDTADLRAARAVLDTLPQSAEFFSAT
ncbi:MAG TPA: adenylate/guanylate cyclase domain-containing protein [Candidatus Binatia bacterium]|nr:adenylate/guanylate cyclase domain-containing protein [Candidatus Binatia bacterium]